MGFVSDAKQTGRGGRNSGYSQKNPHMLTSEPDSFSQQRGSSGSNPMILSLITGQIEAASCSEWGANAVL